jgi:hypothetical protein
MRSWGYGEIGLIKKYFCLYPEREDDDGFEGRFKNYSHKDRWEGLAKAIEEVYEKGFDILLPYKLGNLAMPRIYELAGAINRMRTLKIK